MQKYAYREVETVYIYTNPNPDGKATGDCVIRAIAILLDVTWEKAYTDLCIEGLMMSDLPNSNTVWGSYLRNLGYRREVIPNTCPDCYTIRDFSMDHPCGRYAVCTGTHLVAVINGNVMDAWDSSNEVPTYFYKED